ncbi:tRNA pseudouridine(38-40) synthase TruA [Candidatus Babeliales bacterium]|nr:tRNA pseudouridine(38-40) synthase TruA [Candidatus Babeliales bacterium]
MQNFKIIVAYDGTDFSGWQIQPNTVTVSSTLQKTFKKVFAKPIISLIGASRTDSGVHALHQVARFKAKLNIPLEKILKAWNAQLPKNILIRSLQKVNIDFHPCANVHQKTYYYHLFLKKPLPFIARYGWFYDMIKLVNWQKFEKSLQLYIGKHDFASFCKIDPGEKKDTVRIINSIKIRKIKRFETFQVIIKGKSFLRFQIRRMIGYALDVARRKDLKIDYLKEILDNPNPKQKLLKAEGCGLVLRKIIYKNEFNFKK